jgi:hypothetical protein
VKTNADVFRNGCERHRQRRSVAALAVTLADRAAERCVRDRSAVGPGVASVRDPRYIPPSRGFLGSWARPGGAIRDQPRCTKIEVVLDLRSLTGLLSREELGHWEVSFVFGSDGSCVCEPSACEEWWRGRDRQPGAARAAPRRASAGCSTGMLLLAPGQSARSASQPFSAACSCGWIGTCRTRSPLPRIRRTGLCGRSGRCRRCQPGTTRVRESELTAGGALLAVSAFAACDRLGGTVSEPDERGVVVVEQGCERGDDRLPDREAELGGAVGELVEQLVGQAEARHAVSPGPLAPVVACGNVDKGRVVRGSFGAWSRGCRVRDRGCRRASRARRAC